ncbi:MAG: DUF1573 domain-containing protein [Planctomycetota bacterium]|nr:DUF1573 domain-containing protein [Planctomycetota bacterium]MDP6763218.1 DUF1573 domain-containing protein [Planctomycetota bacterium]MDP6990573.1 DUF1573 domain-containing protein [Planctomycetota bacterium]
MRSLLGFLLAALVVSAFPACGEGGGKAPLQPDRSAPRAEGGGPSATDPAAPLAVRAGGGGERARAVDPEWVEGQAVRFASEQHDFGEVSDTQTLLCTYPFEIVGSEAVVITKVKASCGCMTTSLPKQRFEPGEGAGLELEWEPLGRGKQTKGLTVYSTAFDGGFHRLLATCTVRPFVRVQPQLVYFGEVEMGREHERRATLTCEDPSFVIESIECTNPHVDVAIVDDTNPGPRTVEVTLGAKAPWGQVVGNITARVRGRVPPGDEEVVHEVRFNAHARVFGDLRTDKTMFAVGKVTPGAEFRYEVHLSRASGQPFALLDLGVDNAQPPGMTVTSRPAPEGGYTLVLTGASGGHRGYIRGQVRFATDVPGEPARRLAIAGNVAE